MSVAHKLEPAVLGISSEMSLGESVRIQCVAPAMVHHKRLKQTSRQSIGIVPNSPLKRTLAQRFGRRDEWLATNQYTDHSTAFPNPNGGPTETV